MEKEIHKLVFTKEEINLLITALKNNIHSLGFIHYQSDNKVERREIDDEIQLFKKLERELIETTTIKKEN